jgi:hypothetical protein
VARLRRAPAHQPRLAGHPLGQADVVGQRAGAVDGGRRIAEPPSVGQAAAERRQPLGRVGLVPGGQPVTDPLGERRASWSAEPA